MSKIEKKLFRNKKKTEEREQKKQLRNQLQKSPDFPNLSVPLSLFFLAPAFIILAIVSHLTKQTQFIKHFSLLWSGMGLVSCWMIPNLQQRWFTTYGNKTIIKNEIPWKPIYGIIYITYILLIIVTGLYIKSDLQCHLFTIFIIISCIYGVVNKNAILWDTIPLRLMGYKKYEFTVKNMSYTGILRNYHKIQDEDLIEGAFIGQNWFYLKKGKANTETETASK